MYKFSFFILLLFIISCQRSDLSPYEQEIRTFRTDYLHSFLDEERSPLSASDLADLSFFIADSGYRIEANYTLLPDENAFEIPTSSGKTKTYRKYAKLDFNLKDTSQILFIYESMKLLESEEYADHLFLPFNDLTNGGQTYGGGRYLDLNKKDLSKGKIIIDFNKCYNPWCAYSDGFNCPVPPPENNLDVFVFAGERNFEGAYKSSKNEDEDH